jgi:hypothetical protein
MNKIKLIKYFFLIFFVFAVIQGCSKKSDDQTRTEKTTQTSETDTDALKESNEDLVSVDYKEFYEELSSKGEWVEVDSKELGFIGGSTNFASDLDNKESFFNRMFGVKTAHAEMLQDIGALFVWRPAPELGISLTTGEVPVYMPYSNGQWVNSDAGWYYKAPTPAEEITSHYGRWAYNDRIGWVWVPGRVWAPAWVDYRENADYIAWTPVPPYVYINNGVLDVPVIVDEDRYVIVEKRYYAEPEFHKYIYVENKNKVMIKEMTRINGVMVVNNTIINRGPDVSVIETMLGRPVEKVTITRVDDIDDVKYTTNSYTVYAPKLKKVKVDKSKGPVSKPSKIVKYEEAVSTGPAGMNKREEKSLEKEMKKEEKEINKESKEKGKDINKENKKQEKGKDNGNKKGPEKKIGDDSDMKQGKDKNKGNDNKSGKDKGDKGNNNKGKK